MRRTIYELEDKQEVLDRDVKEIARRLYEKEEYLRELSLFKPGNSIEEAEKMDQKLTETKQLYKENFDVSLSISISIFFGLRPVGGIISCHYYCYIYQGF